jgi:hypothetical protein
LVYLGWTSGRIIERWGEPDKTTPRPDGGKVLEYKKVGDKFVGIRKIPFEAPFSSNPIKLFYHSYDCTIKFTISSENLVVSVNQEGENCHYIDY